MENVGLQKYVVCKNVWVINSIRFIWNKNVENIWNRTRKFQWGIALKKHPVEVDRVNILYEHIDGTALPRDSLDPI